MKIKFLILFSILVTILLYVQPVQISSEETIIIPNVVTDDSISTDIVKSLSLDIEIATSMPYSNYEITFGCLTEVAYSQPLDTDYCDISECSIYDFFTDEEFEFLCQVVEAETYGWYYENHRNVANVIFNRLRNGYWGTTLTAVLTYPNQFMVVTNGLYKKVKVSMETIQAVEDAWVHDYTYGALFFDSTDGTSYAAKHCTFLFRDSAGHDFYK